MLKQIPIRIILEMFKTEVYYVIIGINGYETKIYSIIRTGPHIDF